MIMAGGLTSKSRCIFSSNYMIWQRSKIFDQNNICSAFLAITLYKPYVFIFCKSDLYKRGINSQNVYQLGRHHSSNNSLSLRWLVSGGSLSFVRPLALVRDLNLDLYWEVLMPWPNIDLDLTLPTQDPGPSLVPDIWKWEGDPPETIHLTIKSKSQGCQNFRE